MFTFFHPLLFSGWCGVCGRFGVGGFVGVVGLLSIVADKSPIYLDEGFHESTKSVLGQREGIPVPCF